MDLITLIRNNNCEIKYDVEYHKEWSDDELLSHIIFLDCHRKQLTTLPDLINCQELNCGLNHLTTLPDLINCRQLVCYHNQLTTLPDLINCQQLSCSNNQLTTLPDLINCQELYCDNNQLTTLPDLINFHILWCSHNQLTILPDLINCQILECNNNQLIYNNIKDHKKLVKFRNFWKKLKQLKYLKKWRLYKTKSIINKKKDLMIELLYSPNLPFYKLDSYYIHFIENQNK